MLGSAKVNGMGGHAAYKGDRFSLIPGAQSSVTKGSKYQYYPINPPQNDGYNDIRPSLDIATIRNMYRTPKYYYETIEKLADPQLRSKEREKNQKESGIMKLP